MFTPTIVEGPEDEQVEEDRTEAFWSKQNFASSSGLDLNSIADCLVGEDDDSSFAEACSKLEQRLYREPSQDEVNKTKKSFSKPEVACQPCDLGYLSANNEFNPLGRKQQSMPNVLSPAPSRKSPRLNVFQQLSEQDRVTSVFIVQGQAA